MGDLGGNQSPEIQTVFVETNLGTRLVVRALKDESIASFKDSFCEEHHEIFPGIGEINISALKVKRRGSLYHLSNRMNLSDAFDAISKNWFLYADAAKVAHQKCSNPGFVEGNQEIGVDSVLVEEGLETKVAVAEKSKREKRKVKSSDGKKHVIDGVNQSDKVEKGDLLAIVVADQNCSNPSLVEGNKEIGIDSVLEEEFVTQVDVAEKTTTGKRKAKSSDGKKSRKKRVIDCVNQSAKVEKGDLLATVGADQNCSAKTGLVEGDKEIGIESVLEEGLETQVDVAEKTTTEKRKVESSDVKNRVIDDVNQSAKVEKEDLLAIVVADQNCLNPCLVEENSDIGIDSVHEGEFETEVAVAEKTTTGKRKVKSSDVKKSPKKRVTDESNEVEAVVVEAPTSESSAVLPSKEVDDVLAGAVGKENETGEESVEDTTQTDKLASQPENHLEKKRKRKSKKAKSLAEEESVPILTKNLEPIEVVDGEVADNVIRDVLDSLQEKKGNLDKMENKSSKKSKKKHIEKIVEAQVELNSAPLEEALPFKNEKDTDALFMSPKNVAGNSEDNDLSNQIQEEKADMGDNLCPSQNDDVDDGDKRQDHVIDVAKSKEEKKGLDMYQDGSTDGSLSSMKPKEKKARAQPASSVTSSMVKNGRSGSKVDHSATSAEVAVESKKEAVKNISNSFIDGSVSSSKPKEKKARAQPASSVTSSMVKNGRSGSKVDHSATSEKVAVDSKKEAVKNISNSFIDGSVSSTKPKENRSSDVSSGTPSDSTLDDDDSDVNSMSRKQGNNMSAGGTKLSLVDILRRSASYKAAKLRADQSQAENKSLYDDDNDSLDKLSLHK